MTQTTPPDVDLFHRLSLGDPGALGVICERYGERVMHIARRRMGKMLRRRMETADLAQEAMFEIVRDAPNARFDSEADFLRWVTAVVQHRVARNARHWKAERRLIVRESRGGDGTPIADPWAERPSQVFRRRESMDRLAIALDTLSPDERKVLVARLMLGLPWSAVSSMLNTSEACAQMRYVRAKRRLALTLRVAEGGGKNKLTRPKG